MYICQICGKHYDDKDLHSFVLHHNKCWKEHNPNHKSGSAPRSEDINTNETNEEVANFFNSFK